MRQHFETASAPATPSGLGAPLTGLDFRRTPPPSADRARSRDAPRRNSLERLNELIGSSGAVGRGASFGGASRSSGEGRCGCWGAPGSISSSHKQSHASPRSVIRNVYCIVMPAVWAEKQHRS